MRRSRSAFIVVGLAASIGWFWHIAQDSGVDILIRMPLGIFLMMCLAAFLGHRLEEGYWAFPDVSRVRLIPPPRVGRWAIVALSKYSNRPDQTVGRYRTRWTARLIASRLPHITHDSARFTYVVRRADQAAPGTEQTPTSTQSEV